MAGQIQSGTNRDYYPRIQSLAFSVASWAADSSRSVFQELAHTVPIEEKSNHFLFSEAYLDAVLSTMVADGLEGVPIPSIPGFFPKVG